jgi:phospholipid/cholesterol/gamma-HCH transport system substrate-binding protein
MRIEIPRARLTVFLLAALAAAGLFLYLNSTFGGPTLIPTGGSSYELRASFPDSQNLVRKSLVMYRGFQVGYVDSVKIVHARAQVTFTIDSRYAPLPAGTMVQVDHRTFLQEPFVNVYPGPMRGHRLRSGSSVGSIPTVEPDDALQVFDPETRRLLDRGTQSLARGLRAPTAGDEVNGTIGGLDQTLRGIRQVATTLHGQEQDISALVSSSATVLQAIASQQSSLTTLISSGRVVAQTFAAQAGAFGRGLDQLNALLSTAQTALPITRPFLARARPALQHLASTAGLLTPALAALRPAVRAARSISRELEPSARAAVPAFLATIADERWLRPLAVGVRPTVQNLVPLMAYIRSQLRGWEAMIGNLADTLNHGDSQGPWLQGFLDLTLGGVVGGAGPCSSALGLCVNPYPRPGDAANPQPYQKGQFPRLKPWHPPR